MLAKGSENTDRPINQILITIQIDKNQIKYHHIQQILNQVVFEEVKVDYATVLRHQPRQTKRFSVQPVLYHRLFDSWLIQEI